VGWGFVGVGVWGGWEGGEGGAGGVVGKLLGWRWLMGVFGGLFLVVWGVACCRDLGWSMGLGGG